MAHHADTVGSYLRPSHLLEARKKKEGGQLELPDLRKIEDVAIRELVEKEVAAGLKVVTDGEYRRNDFFTDFLCGFNGVKIGNTTLYKDAFSIPKFEEEGWKIPQQFLGYVPVPYVYGKIAANPNHPEYAGFEYLKSVTPNGITPKIVVPSPIFLTIFRSKDDPYPKDTYSNVEDFYNDISVAFKDTFLKFYEKGIKLIQIDEPAIPVFPYLLSTDRDEQFKIMRENIAIFLKILKPVVASLPSDLLIAIHLCKGNGHSHFKIPFTYHDFLPLFSELSPQPRYLLLEWDDERSGSLEVLKEYAVALPKSRFFLGFVTTKNSIIESEEYVIGKIKEASQYVPLPQLGLTPQCGFGTMKEGNPITEEAQWGKVKLLGTLAKKIWGDE